MCQAREISRFTRSPLPIAEKTPHTLKNAYKNEWEVLRTRNLHEEIHKTFDSAAKPLALKMTLGRRPTTIFLFLFLFLRILKEEEEKEDE